MTTQQQEQQHDIPQHRKQRIKYVPWIRLGVAFVAFIVVFVVGYLFVIGLLNIQASIILAFISIIIGLLQWLFPISTSKHEQSVTHTHASPTPQTPPVLPAVQPIIVQVPTTQPLVVQSSPPDKLSHRGIVGLLPPIDPRTIQQREHLVKDVYAKLIQPGITAIALTGIGGVGKSTLAALLYRYAEEQRHTHTSPFLAEAIWLTVDPAVTFADLAGNLFEALGKPLPDLSNLAPQNQAVALFNALNTTDKPRLIILDQFENLLDWDTGHALTDRPGVGEWLDIINSQQCTCRILLTSRPRPVGTREYLPTNLQEYPVGGLEVQEGIALLQSQGVQGKETELQTAVSHCAGHAFSLMLLASLMRDHHMNLATLFKNSAFWTGDIATNILDQIYKQRLSDVQRDLLLAFSVYREPVLLEAAYAVISKPLKVQISLALKTLLTQHLLEPVGEARYQLHAIVADYAQSHFDESNEQANEEALQAAHSMAGQYYLQRAKRTCPVREKRRKVADIPELIEAIWQYCQAGKWQEAYDLMEQEGIFEDLKRWGGNAVLLELYQLLLPLEKWKPVQLQAALIYNKLGRVYRTLGRKLQARQYLELASSISRAEGYHREEGAALSFLGRVYADLGQNERALTYLMQALNIRQKVRDREGEGWTLDTIGRVYADLGQKERARHYCEEALSIHREVSDRRGVGTTLNYLGVIYDDLGKKEQALEYYEQALRIRREIGDRGGEGKTLNNLGRVYSTLGKKEEALKYYEQALSIFEEVGDRGGEGRVFNNLASVCDDLGRRKEALKYYEQALSIFEEIGDRGGKGTILNNLGRAYNLLGRKKQALKYYEQAICIIQEVGDRGGEGVALHNIGTLYLEEEKYSIALANFLCAKKIFEEVQSPSREVSQRYIGRLREELGDEQFTALLATVEPQAQQIVDRALREGLE